MAKPNYSFERRQREIAKKKQKEEKRAKKRAAKEAKNPGTGAPEPTSAENTPAPTSAENEG